MFKKILFFGLSIFFYQSLQSFFTKLYLLKDPNTEHYVYLLGDIHNSTSLEEQWWNKQKDFLNDNLQLLDQSENPPTILVEGEIHSNQGWGINRSYNSVIHDIETMTKKLAAIKVINIENRPYILPLTINFFQADRCPCMYGFNPEAVRKGIQPNLFDVTYKKLFYCFVHCILDLTNQCQALADNNQKMLIKNLLQAIQNIFDDFNKSSAITEALKNPTESLLKRATLLTIESVTTTENLSSNIDVLIDFDIDKFIANYSSMPTDKWKIFQDKISTCVRNLYKEYANKDYDKLFDRQEKRSKIFIGLLKSFTMLLDANVLLTIFKKKQENKPIIVIAGNAHIENIKEMLCKIGYHDIFCSKDSILRAHDFACLQIHRKTASASPITTASLIVPNMGLSLSSPSSSSTYNLETF